MDILLNMNKRNRFIALLLSICIVFSLFSGVELVKGASRGITVGSSGSIGAGSYTAGSGALHMYNPAFRVGVQRSTELYNDGTKASYDNIVSNLSKHVVKNTNTALFLMNQTAYNRVASSSGASIGWYNGSGKTLVYESNPEIIAKMMSVPNSGSKTNIYKPKLQGYNSTGENGKKLFSDLADGAWKALLDTGDGSKERAVWGWILENTNGSNGVTTHIDDRLNEYISVHAKKGVDMSSYTTIQQDDITRGMIDILMTLYKIAPQGSSIRTALELAINDYVKGAADKDNPVAIVIDPMIDIGISGVQGLGNVLIPIYDYVMYLGGVENKYNIYSLGSASPSTYGNSDKMILDVVQKSMNASPNLKRIARAYDSSSAFSNAEVLMFKDKYLRASGTAHYRSSSIAKTPYMEIIKFANTNNGTMWGYMVTGYSVTPPAGEFKLTAEKKKVKIPDSQPTIGQQAELTLTDKSNGKNANDWQRKLKTGNETVKVKIKMRRTPNGGTYQSSDGDYFTVGYDMPKDDFLAFMRGLKSIKFTDNIANDPIANNETKQYKYWATVEITYKDGTTDKTFKAKETEMDYASYYKGPPLPVTPEEPEPIEYASKPETFAEIKEGTIYNESYEAMAGVPSTEKLYFAVGGSEFIVDMAMEYKQDTEVWRTYHSYFTQTDCEYKGPDTAGSFSVGGYTADAHAGGSWTKRFTGNNTHTQNPTTCGTCGASGFNACTVDNSNFEAAMEEAKAYAEEVNGVVITHTAGSDGETREFDSWGASASGSPDNSSNAKPPSGGSGCLHGGCSSTAKDHTHSGGNCSSGSACSSSHAFVIEVSFSLPAHIICGPCCEHILPQVNDKWKQSITYDHLDMVYAHVWRIDEGHVDGMEEVLGTDEVRATIVQGEPNVFFNFAKTESSKDGRLRYTVEPEQHDNVVWDEGVRTNTCNGLASRHGSGGGGHGEDWGNGIIYNNTNFTNEVDYHKNTADDKDKATPEFAKFDERRTTQNVASVISDMLILQTSSGDQSVIYFRKDSESKQTQENFPKVVATKAEMWDNNANSSANWEADEINIGSYNGEFNKPTSKYKGNGGNAKVETIFDDDPAKTIKRPERRKDLRIFKDGNQIQYWIENKAYVTGKATVFYENIIKYPQTNANSPFSFDANPMFGNQKGDAFEGFYSPEHTKVNNLIIHTPVSAEDAIVVGLPEDRDQRSSLPLGTADDLIEQENKLKVCPLDPASCEFRVLNCKYHEKVLLADFDFENGAKNKVTDKSYNLPSGFTIENANRFGSGKSLKAFGTRWSIPFSDLGIDNSDRTSLYIEMDLHVPKAEHTKSSMLISTLGYDLYFYKNAEGYMSWNSGNGVEKRINENFYDKKIKLGVKMSFGDIEDNEVYIDGRKVTNYTRVNNSVPLQGRIGNALNIGSWGSNDNYPAQFYIDNLKIYKAGGTSDHTNACYKKVTVHGVADVHEHTADCIGTAGGYACNNLPLNDGKIYTCNNLPLNTGGGYACNNLPLNTGGGNIICNNLPLNSYTRKLCQHDSKACSSSCCGRGECSFCDYGAYHNPGDGGYITGSKIPCEHDSAKCPTSCCSGGRCSKCGYDGYHSAGAGNLVTRNYDAHTHTDACKSGFTSHTHTSSCKKTEATHTHTTNCSTKYTTHTHTVNCPKIASGSLNCGYDAPLNATSNLNVHEHTSACGTITNYTCNGADTSYTLNYTGGTQTFTIPETGKYLIETWGASGGGNPKNGTSGSRGGFGGYSKGEINLNKGDNLIVEVGGQGTKSTGLGTGGGYNGGGHGGVNGFGGGGMTSITNEADIGGSQVMYWNFDGTTHGFTNISNTSISNDSTCLIVKATGTDPHFQSPIINIPTSDVAKIVFKMKNTTGQRDGQVFFSINGSDFNESKSVRFDMDTSGKYVYYSLDMRNHPEWKGNLNRLRFDFGNAHSTGDVHIARLYLISDNGKELIIAGGGGGADNLGGAIGGADDGTGGDGGGLQGGNAYIDGKEVSNNFAPNIAGLKKKTFGGASWARVLYQDISLNRNYFTTSNMGNVNQSGLFSCLDRLEEFRGADGKFEFMLNYPDSYGAFAGAYNRWKQTSNPYTEQRTNSGTGGANAVGFEPIHMDMQGYGGKGLEFNGVGSVLDGIVNHGNWWLAVGILNGSYSPTNTLEKPYTMPGPNGTQGSQGVSQVELWVRTDNLGTGTGKGGTQSVGYKRGLGESATRNTDTGGGGAGYWGGSATNNNQGGAGGGSGYVSPKLSNSGTTTSNHIGNGKVVITKKHVHTGACATSGVTYTCGSAIKNAHVCMDDYMSGKREYSGKANYKGKVMSVNGGATIDAKGTIHVPAGGARMYGPYDTYYMGTYLLTVKGTNLSGVNWTMYDDGGKYQHDYVIIKDTPTESKFIVTVKKDTKALEFTTVSTPHSFTVSSLTVEPITLKEPIAFCKGCNKNTIMKPVGNWVRCSSCNYGVFDLGEEITLLTRCWGGGSTDPTNNRLTIAGRGGRRLLYTPFRNFTEEWTGNINNGPGSEGKFKWGDHVLYTSAIINPCEPTETLKCGEPHHNGMHYDGSNDICWDACGIDDNHKHYKPTIDKPDGTEIPNGKFVNLDYPFQIYFPNIGDFQDTGRLGIAELSSERGKGYTDNMDTTKWTREKRVKFDFNVIYDGQLYLTGEWIELPVTGDTYPYYDFYCVLANSEAKGANVEFEVEAINATGQKLPDYNYPHDTNTIYQNTDAAINDNLTKTTNRDRTSDYRSKHGAYNHAIIDVVGRIGNFVVMDTEDYRFSNWFKEPKVPTSWLIEGFVKEVDQSSQRAYLGDTIDIRGIKIGDDTKELNTHGSQDWLEMKPTKFPLTHDLNNISQLKDQPLRIGYSLFGDISSIGNYENGALQIIPYYYRLNIDDNTLTPLDAYMSVDGVYKPINIFDLVQNGTYDESKVYDYVVNMDWVAENVRRNYTLREKFITDSLSDMRAEPVIPPGSDVATGLKAWDRPLGRYIKLGNAQRLLLGPKARTFIGGEETYGELFNLGDRIPEDQWWQKGQRWHFKLGVPSSTVFVEHGDEPTKENIAKVMHEKTRILITSDIQSIGDTYSLRYEQKDVETIKVDGKTFVLPDGLPPVVGVMSGDKSSILDVDTTGTH